METVTDEKEQITACVSAGFIIFDVMDAVKAYNLIGKCNSLDDATRLALKQSKRYGEKAFQNCDLPSLNKIGKELPQPHATEIFNMKNTTEVVDTLYRSSKPKVMQNLASLEAKQVPIALDFFPNNIQKNTIWLSVVDEPSVVINPEKYNEISMELINRSKLLENPNPTKLKSI